MERVQIILWLHIVVENAGAGANDTGMHIYIYRTIALQKCNMEYLMVIIYLFPRRPCYWQ